MQAPAPCGVVSLLTDFGTADPYVGVMKGAVLRQNRTAAIVDLCHEVPPQAIEIAAVYLGAAVGYFPGGTVHLAVVDPGVGTARRVLAACAAGCYWLAPDNGVLDRVLALDGCEVRAVDAGRLGLPEPSPTFHGRDVFAPVAGMLSRGRYGFRALGPPATDPVRLARDERPRVVFVDRFGNLITNVELGGGAPPVAVAVAGREVPFARTYAEVPVGAPLALRSSFGLLEIAVHRGRADTALGVGVGAPIELR